MLSLAKRIEQVRSENLAHDQLLSEARAFMFPDGEGYTLSMEMTVCDVNILWEEGYSRADDWEKRFEEQQKELRDQLKQLGSRDRKARAPINDELKKLADFAKLGHALHGEAFEEAQEKISADVAISWACCADHDEHSEEFKAAYRKARSRGRFSLTRYEAMMEHASGKPSLITRLRSQNNTAGAEATAPAA